MACAFRGIAACSSLTSICAKKCIRSWVDVAPVVSDAERFKVMTWNVLAESLARGATSSPHPMPTQEETGLEAPGAVGIAKYTEVESEERTLLCQQRYLKWAHRWPLMREELFAHGAMDIVALQEVDKYESFERVLGRRGYEGVFAKKQGRCKDGCALFWRKAVFSAEDFSCHNLSVPFVALFQRLRSLSTKESILVIVTHLKAGFSDDMEAKRAMQSSELLALIRQHRQDEEPVVVLGDFNSHPIDVAHVMDAKVHPLWTAAGFQSAYAGVEAKSYTAWSGWVNQEVKVNCDYIFSKGAVTTKIVPVPVDESIASIPERLPNQFFPSDHMALVAELQIP